MARLTNLPTELALAYMGYLSSSDLYALALTTKALRDAALDAAYRHITILPCERPDRKYNHSHRRIVKLTITLLRNPTLANKVTSLDVDLVHHDYEGIYKPLMSDAIYFRSAADRRLIDLAAEVAGPYTQHRDWICQGNVVGWTYLLFIIVRNLAVLRLGPGFGVFVEDWRDRMYDYDRDDCDSEELVGPYVWDGIRGMYVRRRWRPLDDPRQAQPRDHVLAHLPGLRSVRHVQLDGAGSPSWEWLTLPSLRSYSHGDMARLHVNWREDRERTVQALWPENCVSNIRTLYTTMPTVHDRPRGFDPPFSQFPHLKTVYINLVIRTDRPIVPFSGLGAELGIFTVWGEPRRPFQRLSALAPTLESLDVRLADGPEVEMHIVREQITELHEFARLKHFGIPACVLTSKVDDSEDELELRAGKLLPIEMWPPCLETLSIFANGKGMRLGLGDRIMPYGDALSETMSEILGRRYEVLSLRYLRVDFVSLDAEALARLPLEELQGVGIGVENILPVPAFCSVDTMPRKRGEEIVLEDPYREEPLSGASDPRENQNRRGPDDWPIEPAGRAGVEDVASPPPPVHEAISRWKFFSGGSGSGWVSRLFGSAQPR